MKFRFAILVLTLLNVGLAAFYALQDPSSKRTIVLTPLVDIWPSETPLTSSEQERLLQRYSFVPESRGLERVYARMGATLSVHDLLRGIHFLEHSEIPLSPEQKEKVLRQLRKMQEEHHQLQRLQKELIEKEDTLFTILDQLGQE